YGRRVDVSVAMDLAIAQEAGIFQPGDETQYACLLAKTQMVLEADQVVAGGAQIFLAKLHHRIGHAPAARIDQSDRLHRAEAQSVAAAARDFFNGQAGLEIIQLLPAMAFD